MRVFEPVTDRYLTGFYAARVVLATRAALQHIEPATESRERAGLLDRLRDTGRRLLDRLRHLGKAQRQRRIPITSGLA